MMALSTHNPFLPINRSGDTQNSDGHYRPRQGSPSRAGASGFEDNDAYVGLTGEVLNLSQFIGQAMKLLYIRDLFGRNPFFSQQVCIGPGVFANLTPNASFSTYGMPNATNHSGVGVSRWAGSARGSAGIRRKDAPC